MLLVLLLVLLAPFSCNLPPVRAPECDYPPVAPPAASIPPACVAALEAATWDEDGETVTEATITVVHPELNGAQGRVRVARYGNVWRWIDLQADASCAKDEAPLAWAVTEALNGRWAALDIYAEPLPRWFVSELRRLGGQRHRLYFPLVEVR